VPQAGGWRGGGEVFLCSGLAELLTACCQLGVGRVLTQPSIPSWQQPHTVHCSVCVVFACHAVDVGWSVVLGIDV
jgi:hypothetical protein